jgi:hypothetical protein
MLNCLTMTNDNRSLDRSRFKVTSNYLNMFRMGACIYYNFLLFFFLKKKKNYVCSKLYIQIRSARQALLQFLIRLIYHAQNELLHLLELVFN